MPNVETVPEILLVSTSALSRRSIDHLLSGEFTVSQVEDGAGAWDRLQQEPQFSALICELEMCIGNDALLERIRRAQSKAIASLPVLLLVGENVDEVQRDKVFALGATDFINMPFSSSELKTRVRLHTKIFNLYSQDRTFDVAEQGSSIDILNSLMHEQHFRDRLEQEVSFSQRHKTYLSVCLLQIDKADEYYDELGKKVFSGINRAVAQVIGKKVRREDTYAYLGDATFALMYPVTNGLGASIATRRLLEKVAQTSFRQGGEDIPVTLSAGLFSAMPQEKQSADDIMEIIASRLQKAQQKGGNQIVSSKTEQEQMDISIEQALNMISHQRTEGLAKQVPHLLDTVMPLLEFAKEHNEVELEGVVAALVDP